MSAGVAPIAEREMMSMKIGFGIALYLLDKNTPLFADTYAKKRIARLQEIFTPETLQVPKTQAELKELESIHKVLELYVWLRLRLEDSFPDRDLASSQKSICGMLFEEFLERLGFEKPIPKKLKQFR
ncbi:hypothetical protein L2E82_30990 [Cichorium intybus]|uniref:Uncharacterized protein n=1 Tax=Cichorium intybus TaxID=13427 RepID=A0ACB9D1T2_CICIN|nr:hypothetical protein L2E82_30990 [Cichorium intybus]